MVSENMKLRCVQCGAEFEFSASEQAFFSEKGLSTPPKRCRPCRKSHKSRNATKGAGSGIYRSPAFGGSAPDRGNPRIRRGGSTQGRGRPQEYRSPAFRDLDYRNFDEDYRSPAFRDIDRVRPEDEYRSPGFREYADLDVKAEYRSPGFQDLREQPRDERPMFQITCHECAQVSMVPFLPEEKEGPHLCKECYVKKRRRLAQENAASAAASTNSPPED